jgi:hypothetical protein
LSVSKFDLLQRYGFFVWRFIINKDIQSFSFFKNTGNLCALQGSNHHSPIAYGMTFQSQQAAAHGVEEAENLHLDVGPSIIWNSEQDFISNLQFREIFDLNHQIHSFDTQKEPVSISNGSYVFSPLKHAGPSHTGPPFKSTQPLISEPHFRNTDSLISGKKQAEMVAVGSQLQRDSLGINWDVHIDVDDFGVSVAE